MGLLIFSGRHLKPFHMTTEDVTSLLMINCGHGNEVLGAKLDFFSFPYLSSNNSTSFSNML